MKIPKPWARWNRHWFDPAPLMDLVAFLSWCDWLDHVDFRDAQAERSFASVGSPTPAVPVIRVIPDGSTVAGRPAIRRFIRFAPLLCPLLFGTYLAHAVVVASRLSLDRAA